MEENAVWEKQWTPRYLPSLGDEPWDAVWGRLTEGFRPEIVPAGTVLYQQGDPADEVLYAEVLNHRMRLLTRAGEFLLRMTVEELKPIPRTRPRLPPTAACSPPSTGARA